MRSWAQALGAGALAVAVATALSGTVAVRPAAAKTKKFRLFNGKNWDGLYTFVRDSGKNNDPLGVFKIEDGGIIHASGEKFGYVSTDKDYENFHLTAEFKWGEKRWPPRENAKRDAGILYNCIGQDKVWMESLEFQIQEGDCGDMWLTAGAVQGKPKLTVKSKPLDGGVFAWDPNGEPKQFEGGRVVKGGDFEKPKGEWNKVEVITKGDTVRHIINGHVNLEGTNASITKGKINFQSEGAEIYYRNIEIEVEE